MLSVVKGTPALKRNRHCRDVRVIRACRRSCFGSVAAARRVRILRDRARGTQLQPLPRGCVAAVQEDRLRGNDVG